MVSQLRRQCLVLLPLVLLLHGCGGSGGGDGGDQRAGGNGYTVTATARGLDGRLEAGEYATFVLAYTGADGNEQYATIGTDADGPFTFRNAFLPDGARYAVTFRDATNFSVRCDVENGTGVVASANVSDVEIACAPAYTVGGTVSGLEVTAFTGIALEVLHNGEVTPPYVTGFSYTLGTFSSGGNKGFLPGDTYDVRIAAQPVNPSIECKVESGTGTVPEADVVSVEILCKGISVHYSVEGLFGSGMIVRLSAEREVNGNVRMETVDEHSIEKNGRYSFEYALFPGQRYEVTVRQQPVDPDQECFVENGEGVAPDLDGYIVVSVICPEPYRVFRFDNQLTRNEGTPLLTGNQIGGVLYRSFDFGPGPAVPLGTISGFDTSDLFQVHIDDDAAQGVVYSNHSGKTFWVAAESPAGVRQPQPNASHHNISELETWWYFKKESDVANLQLEVSEVYLLAYDDTHASSTGGRLYAEAQLWVNAYAKSGDGQYDREVFSRHGGVALQGKQLADDAPTDWSLVTATDSRAAFGLWDVNAFFFDLIGDEAGLRPEQVALAFLVDSIPIPIDVSQIPTGGEFYIKARTLALARNSYSPEGGTAAILRDPATFEAGDPADPEPLDDAGSVRIVAAEGVKLLALDAPPQPAAGASLQVPDVCESEERSTLQFEEVRYSVDEGSENSTLIRVTRSGVPAGLVSARVRLTGGTANAGSDFEPFEITVLFGDQDNLARTVALPIVDDDVIEADETLTVTLDTPEGCAVIGAQSTAEVTIVDDDNSPGTIAFASARFDVDEGAGLATLSLVRSAGNSGTVAATIESADGLATGSTGGGGDYIPVFTTVTFGDGDMGPREIAVPISDDLITESDETVTFTLSSATASIGSPASAVLTIRDNDQNQASTVQFAAADFVGFEPQAAAPITLTRYGDVSGPASVTLSTSDGTAVAGDDYEALNTVVDFAAGEATQNVEVVILGSPEPEADETVNLVLSDPSGLALGAPSAAALVITEDDGTAWGAWQSDVEIDAAAGAANDAQIAFDGNGNALAVWYQEAASRTDIWSNYYEAGVGWSTAVLVEQNDNDRYAGSPRIAFDDGGNALAVWTQTDAVSGDPSVWSNRFVPASGWGVAELLENEPNAVTGGVELAVHGSGDAVAVWAQFDGANVNVYANRHDRSAGWVGAEIVDELDYLVENPHVAVDGDGGVLAVWQQSDTGVVWDVWARRYTGANGWEAATLLSTTNTGKATSPKAAFDAGRNAFVLWLQNPGFDRAVYATRYTDFDGWDTPQMIGPGDGAEQHRISVDSGGNALAIWRRAQTLNGTVVLTAFVSRFAPGGGWDAPQAISTGDVFYPKAALNDAGTALAVWFELDLALPPASAYSVWSNAYTAGSGWRLAEQIGSSGGLIGTGMPNLAIGPSGEAFAIWTRGGEVRVNRFE